MIALSKLNEIEFEAEIVIRAYSGRTCVAASKPVYGRGWTEQDAVEEAIDNVTFEYSDDFGTTVEL